MVVSGGGGGSGDMVTMDKVMTENGRTVDYDGDGGNGRG